MSEQFKYLQTSNQEINTSFSAPYYQLIRKMVFASSKHYYKFINWIRGEFDLYLQDETNDLQVFLPGCRFNIKHIKGNNDIIIAQINIKSKASDHGNAIINQIMSIYNLLLL